MRISDCSSDVCSSDLPVADAGEAEQHPGGEGAQHVLGAMREVDDVEHAEDHRQAQAQHGVEGAVDESQQQLAEQDLRSEERRLGKECVSKCRSRWSLST